MLTRILPFPFILLVASCASLPTGHDAKPKYSLTDTEQTTIGKRAAEILDGEKEESVMYLVNEGTDAFFARMMLIAHAERSVDVQYFIWHADLIGKLLLNEMIKAADRSVRVRILLDDINIDPELEAMLYAMDQHEYIDVHLYNPFASRSFRGVDFITDAFRINRRMHNKSFTVDGQATIVGGRNIGNEYFSADEESNFQDLDVFAVGPVVNEVGRQFDLYWNSTVVFPVKAFDHNQAGHEDLDRLRVELAEFKVAQHGSKYEKDIQDSEMYIRFLQGIPSDSKRLFKGEVKVVYDDPEKSTGKSEHEVTYLKTQVRPHIDSIEKSLELVSPYFVPGQDGVDYMASLVDRGVSVSVVTNSLSSTDGILAQSGYARRRIELLKGGVELYEMKADSKTSASRSLRRSEKAKSGLHAKTYIFDRDEVFIGSFNFDQRSANINSEVGVIYKIPEMARFISESIFDEAIKENAYRVGMIIEDVDVDGVSVPTEKIFWIETMDGVEIRHSVQPETSAWRRFNEQIFSIMPIESQL